MKSIRLVEGCGISVTPLCLACVIFLCVEVTEGATLRNVALSGHEAPGAPVGAQFSTIINAPVVNDQGQVAFSAFLEPGVGGTTTDNDIGVWSEGFGTLRLVAIEGNQAPNLAASVLFDSFSRPSISNAGETAFYGRLKVSSGNVTNENNTALWSEANGYLHPVAREGDSAPNVPVGSRFRDLGVNNSLRVQNGAGASAFQAVLATGFGGVDINNDQGDMVNSCG